MRPRPGERPGRALTARRKRHARRRSRHERVTCTLLARGWNAEVIHHPTLMVATTAPAKAFESAFDAS